MLDTTSKNTRLTKQVEGWRRPPRENPSVQQEGRESGHHLKDFVSLTRHLSLNPRRVTVNAFSSLPNELPGEQVYVFFF